MIIIGIDPSLTGTGIAAIDTATREYTTETIDVGKLRGHERIEVILKRVRQVARDTGGQPAIEGPAFGAQSATYHQLAGLWHLVDHTLWLAGAPPVVIVNVQTVKIYATGKANENKEQVMMQVGRRFPAFEGDNNAADALIVGAALADRIGLPIVAMPQTHRRGLIKPLKAKRGGIELPPHLADLAPAFEL